MNKKINKKIKVLFNALSSIIIFLMFKKAMKKLLHVRFCNFCLDFFYVEERRDYGEVTLLEGKQSMLS